MTTRTPGDKRPTPAEVAQERDRISSRLIEQERAKTLQKTLRLRALRLAHEDTLRAAEPPPKAAATKRVVKKAK